MSEAGEDAADHDDEPDVPHEADEEVLEDEPAGAAGPAEAAPAPAEHAVHEVGGALGLEAPRRQQLARGVVRVVRAQNRSALAVRLGLVALCTACQSAIPISLQHSKRKTDALLPTIMFCGSWGLFRR